MSVVRLLSEHNLCLRASSVDEGKLYRPCIGRLHCQMEGIAVGDARKVERLVAGSHVVAHATPADRTHLSGDVSSVDTKRVGPRRSGEADGVLPRIEVARRAVRANLAHFADAGMVERLAVHEDGVVTMVGLELKGVLLRILNLRHTDVEIGLVGVGLCVLRTIEEDSIIAERCRRVATAEDDEEVTLVVGIVAEVETEVALQVFHRHVDAVPLSVALEVGHGLMEGTITFERCLSQDDVGSMTRAVVDDEVERCLRI